MEYIIITFLAFAAGCSSVVLVRHQTCEKIAGDIYRCEQVK